MAKYKVVSISMSRGGHKKPAQFGDILTDADLVATGQNPHEMVSKGFLEVVEGSEKTASKKVEPKKVEKVEKTDAPEDDAPEDDAPEDDEAVNAFKENLSNDDSENDKQPIFTTKGGKLVFDIDDCKKSEIIVELERREIEFSKTDNKPVLWELL